MFQKPKLVKLSRLFAILMALLTVLYCAWAWFSASGTVYWPTYYPMPCSWLVAMSVGVLVLFPAALALAQWGPRYLVPLAVIAGLCFCGGTLISFVRQSHHLKSARLGDQVYHLAHYIDDNGLARYKLCECEGSGIFCQCHTFYRNGWSWPSQTEIIVDTEANELHIQIDGELIYTYGAQPRCHTHDCWTSE